MQLGGINALGVNTDSSFNPEKVRTAQVESASHFFQLTLSVYQQ